MSFDGVTGDLALALGNTACREASCCASPPDYAALIDLVAASGALDPEGKQRLLAAPPDPQREAVRAILAFRDVIRASVDALALGRPLSDALLGSIDDALRACGCARSIVRDAGTYRSIIRFAIAEPRDLLMPIAHSLADLITASDPTRLKQCREPRCSCYFIDTSKNRTRTWCSMQRCGNRQKVANYYRRSRKNETAEARVPRPPSTSSG
ncbi:MAG TPA: CGNR zinc finger domain-containing protein [Candidatus Aquilonibacter sp.]|nr:CGNR zinc finger domain-containing protein [Candidatus Aquilonibacter sp.]